VVISLEIISRRIEQFLQQKSNQGNQMTQVKSQESNYELNAGEYGAFLNLE